MRVWNSIVAIKRYIWFFRPFMPKLSKRDVEVLKDLGLYHRKLPFPIIRVESKFLIDFIGVPYGDSTHYHNLAFSADDGLDKLQKDFSERQPQTLAELWGLDLQDLKKMPAGNFGAGGPFGLHTPNASLEGGDCAHFGPATDPFLKSEWLRLQNARDGLSRGYLPWKHWDGFIRGVLVTDGKDYCFVVSAGKHRSAVVSRSQRNILVRLEWFHTLCPIIDLRRVDAVPSVVSGYYLPETVKALADKLLETAAHAKEH